MALSSDIESGEQTAPLGRAVIVGLAASTIAVLIVLPLVFAIAQLKASRVSASLHPDDEGVYSLISGASV